MFERCIYFNINALTRDINKIWDDAFQRLGLSPAHAYVLRLVLDEPGITQKAIAQDLHLDPSTVTRFIDTLSNKQLLIRKPHPDNQRISSVFPTTQAKKLHAELEKTGTALYALMRKKIGARKFDNLVKALRETRAALDNDTSA